MTGSSAGRTVKTALAALRANHLGVLDDVVRGDRVLWIGSGVSRGQVPDVVELIRMILSFLQDRMTSTDANDSHFVALRRIVAARLPGELASFDADPRTWAVPNDLESLRSHYSEILAEEVDPHPSDYLLWDAVNVRETYGSPNIAPGPQHVLLGILIQEGVIRSIASANWDGLIEAAASACDGSARTLAVLVSNDDFRTQRGDAELYKFHGCAVRARTAPDDYRAYLVAQTVDIVRWNTEDRFRAVREKLGTLAETRKAVLLGLSAQDYDILGAVAGATKRQPWPWIQDSPAYFFAEPSVQNGHRNIMKIAYGETYDTHRNDIAPRSTAGMYSGPVLGALVVHTIVRKLQASISRATDININPGLTASLEAGVERLADRALTYAGCDLARLVSLLIGGYASLVGRYLEPAQIAPPGRYRSVAPGTLRDIAAKPEPILMNVPEFAVLLGLLGVGEDQKLWQLRIECGLSADRGVLAVLSVHRATSTRIVLVRDARAASEFKSSEIWQSASTPLVVIQASGERPAPMARGLARRIGSARKSHPVQKEAWLSEIRQHAADTSSLLDAFRAEVSI